MIQASNFSGDIFDIPIKFYPDGMVRIMHEDVPKSIHRIALRTNQDTAAIEFYAFASLLHALECRGRLVQAMLPSFPGARQDRLNDSGDYLFSVDFNARLLNGGNGHEFQFIDPHSLALTMLCSGPAAPLSAAFCINVPKGKYAAVIAPDAGAASRANAVAKKLNVPCFQAWKKRDISTGALSGFGVEPLTGIQPTAKILIVDDICDGGGTFVGLAGLLKDYDPHLWVTHGYFTQGLAELKKHYSHIYTTDSIVGAPRDGVIEIPIVQKWLQGEI